MNTNIVKEANSKVSIGTKKKKNQSKLVLTCNTEKWFSQLFSKLDNELLKLFALEQEKVSLGNDGFMPLLSAGQSLCRIVEIVSRMMFGQPTLT